MNKYSILIALLSLIGGAHALAQTTPEKEGDEKDKQETVQEIIKTEKKPTAVIKAVPAARNKNAKPAKVSSAKPRSVRPGGARPAKNARPSSRPVRPGNGRN